MPHVKTWKNALYSYVLGSCIFAASALGSSLKADARPALSVPKADIVQFDRLPSISDSLKTPERQTIDISNIAGVHRTENGLTSNDFTIENPDDLYAVQRIFDTLVENTARTTPAGQKIVYIIGESHYMTAHTLAQICLNSAITKIHGPSSHVFCYEGEYNFFEKIVEKRNLVPNHIRGRLHEYDPRGRTQVQTLLTLNPSTSVTSDNIRLTYVLKQDIPIMFTDAGSIDGDRIDPTDTVARDVAMQMHGVDLNKENLHLTEKLSFDKDNVHADDRGFEVRNGVMVTRALEFAEIHNADVIMQQCGGTHIFNSKVFKDGAFKNSLSALFAMQGYRVVPIFLNKKFQFLDEYVNTASFTVPDTAWIEFPDAVIVRGISEESFSYDKLNLDKESNHINKLSQEYRKKAGIPAPFDIPVEKPSLKEYTKNLLLVLDTAAMQAPK